MKLRNRFVTAGTGLAGIALAGAASAAPQATFTVIDPIGPDDRSHASGVVADGRVVVGTVTLPAPAPPFRQVPYRWTPYTGVQLLDVPTTSFLSSASKASEDGLWVVGSVFNGVSYVGQIWDVTKGSARSIPLPVGAGGGFGGAWDVTPDGLRVVGTWDSGLYSEAWTWTEEEGTTSLGDFPGGFYQSHATAVTDDGRVIVGAGSFQYPRLHAYRWTEQTGLVGLGDLPGGLESSFANAVDADGDVIVGWGTTDLGQEAFRWTATGGMVSIATFPGQISSSARATDADGETVVGLVGYPSSQVPGETRWDGWIWTSAAPQATLLTDHLTQLGVPGLAGWRLSPFDISRDGNVIVGQAHDTLGRQHSFVASLAPIDEGVGFVYCSPSQPNSTGALSSLTLSGLANVVDDALTARASRLPAGALTMALASRDQGHVVMPGGSQGTLCLGGGIGRYTAPGQVQSASAAGTFELPLPLGALPTPGGLVAGQPGETWYFQAWHRDQGPAGATSNLTNGVGVTLR